MSLELLPRIPFGDAKDPGSQVPWSQPVSAFDLRWLSGTFVPAQRDRLARVTTAISAANKEIDQLRAKASAPIEVGERRANGLVLRSGNDAQLERTLRTHAQQQLVRDIIKLREPLDKTVTPILRDMSRAASTADTLRTRVFDKISCLSRAGISGMKMAELMAFKASVMTVIHHVSPIELNRMIQSAIDAGGGDALPTLDCLRMENFSRTKDNRGGDNARLLGLANIPEFNEAGPLLDEVQTLNQQALLEWAQFANSSSRVSTMKIQMGMNRQTVKNAQDDPYSDL